MLDIRHRIYKEINEEFDKQLIALSKKHTPHIPLSKLFNQKKPKVPDSIKFPFMMILYRKKISLANPQYIVALPIMTFSGMKGLLYNLKHKGWGKQVIMMDLLERLEPLETNTRNIFYKVHNWDSLLSKLSDNDKLLIPALKEQYPCPIVQLKDKKGQYKFIM